MADPYAKQQTEQHSADEPSEIQQPATKVALFTMSDPYAKQQTATTEQQSSNPAIQQSSNQQPTTLTQADLEIIWKSMFDSSKLATFRDPDRINTHLKDITPQAGDDGKSVIITLTSSYAEFEVKKILAEVMTHLRHSSGIHDLTPKIVVKAEEKAAMPYQSGEKYEAMLQINPMLAELRKILPDIDI